VGRAFQGSIAAAALGGLCASRAGTSAAIENHLSKRSALRLKTPNLIIHRGELGLRFARQRTAFESGFHAKREKLADLTQREAQPFRIVNEAEPVEHLGGVDPITRKASLGLGNKALALVETQCIDAYSRRICYPADRHLHWTIDP
jgi:hypothetical protein